MRFRQWLLKETSLADVAQAVYAMPPGDMTGWLATADELEGMGQTELAH